MSKDGLPNQTPKTCTGCIYRARVNGATSICDFAGMTGKLRNCSVSECPYYIKKGRKKHNSIKMLRE
jgi:hypothetical protein